MTNTIPHDHHHHHHHHQEMDHQLQALAVKPQGKRQARRRTHTSRPYQERLLNMAEARREIVTALKIHRASTSTRQQQQSTYQHRQEPPLLQLQQQQEEQQKQQVQVLAFQDRSQAAAVIDQEASLAHTATTASYAAASFGNPLCNSPLAHWIAAGSYCSPPPPILRLPCDLTPPELPPTAAMAGLVELEHYQGGLERLVRSLPAQPLGLNLSFQGFGVSMDDVVATANKDGCEDDFFGSLPLAQPSPAASYSYSPPAVETASATTHAYGHGSPALIAADAENHSVIDAAPAAAAAVPVLDGGEMMMAQASSTGGDTLGVDWGEAAAADVAAWWSKIFESGQRASPNTEDVTAAAAGLPAEWRWLCGDDAGLGEQAAAVAGDKPSPDVLVTMMRVDDRDGDGDYSCCYEGGRSDDGEDVALPSMDGIGDDTEEGWDGEWFSCS